MATISLGIVVGLSSRRRHTRLQGDWSSDVCSSDLSARSVSTRNRRRWRSCCGRYTGDLGDRKSVVSGQSVDLGGRRIIKKKKKYSNADSTRNSLLSLHPRRQHTTNCHF